MNTNDKLVAAARRAARKHAREHAIPHQKSLDLIAVLHGRPTWKAFLLDPVPVDEAASAAATEPDFTRMDPRQHFPTAVRYGASLGAIAFSAGPRDWDDARPVLAYVHADGIQRGIDARGLDLDAVAASCMGDPRDDAHAPPRQGDAMPVVDGILLRTSVDAYAIGAARTAVIGVALDGRDPPRAVRPCAPAREAEAPGSHAPMRLPGSDLLGSKQRRTLRDLTRLGVLDSKRGPVFGHVGRRKLHLTPGHHLMSFSPPGTGRMAALSVPALLSDDHASYVVHDDGQHVEMTSGHRASIGRVAIVRVDGDSPDAINPLDAAWMPRHPQAVAKHVDAVMRSLIPKDAAVARLLSEIALRRVRENGGTTLREVHRDATASEHPLANQAAMGLAPLVSRAADEACGRNTVRPEDLRGRAMDGGRPITIYLVRGQRVGSERDPIIAAIQTVIWLWTLSYGPGERIDDGRLNGPCPLVCLLIDLHRLPLMTGIVEALYLGRAKRLSLIITGAAGAAITARYGEEAARDMTACATIRLATQQSDPWDMPFVDPHDQVGYGTLSKLDARQAYLMTSMGLAPLAIDREMFYRNPRLLERTYNPRTGRGPRPVG